MHVGILYIVEHMFNVIFINLLNDLIAQLMRARANSEHVHNNTDEVYDNDFSTYVCFATYFVGTLYITWTRIYVSGCQLILGWLTNTYIHMYTSTN